MKYSLDTDFSSLNGPKARNWIQKFPDNANSAFAASDSRSILLGNLLIIEQYLHTLRLGLAERGKQPSAVCLFGIDHLWDCLEGRIAPTCFQDFANNLYACTLAHSVGEDLTDIQKEFDQEHFTNANDCEQETISWVAILLMELVSVAGGRMEFDVFKIDRQLDFYGLKDMLSLLTDAYIGFTNTPLLSGKSKEYMIAEEQVYQTTLFRQLINRILNTLKTALSALPEQYSALREEYRQYTLIPEEHAVALVNHYQ